MTGGEDKEGHVVTFKTWIRNTNADFLFLCKSGIVWEKWETRGRTKRNKTQYFRLRLYDSDFYALSAL